MDDRLRLKGDGWWMRDTDDEGEPGLPVVEESEPRVRLGRRCGGRRNDDSDCWLRLCVGAKVAIEGRGSV